MAMGSGLPDEVEALRARVRELERRVRVLRTSRRVLMTLVSRLEQERRSEVARHERERGRLQRRNARYARIILERHRHIVQLERLLTAGEIASTGRDETSNRRSDRRNDADR